ncbi:MAG TPA: hypothetical protein EYQ24_04305 [Bacteroidetes bacterium]|nr:hypothetical protein [Bacteroidota bacterium]
MVYSANTSGVLEYDGDGWRLHTLPDSVRQLVRSVAVDPSGTVYVGGIGFVGYLAPDESNTLRIESLVGHIAPGQRDFGDVWTTHVSRGGVVFQAANRLFRWNGRRMQSWETGTRYHKAFRVGREVYVREEGVGLRRLEVDGLVTVAGGEAFADRKVFALLQHPRGLLAAVVDEGLVLLKPSGAETLLDGVASGYLRQFRPYAGVQIGGEGEPGAYAFGTFGGGVLVVDDGGRVERVYKEDVGLRDDDFVVGVMDDAQGGLWLALLDGLLRLDLVGRVTTFADAEGLHGQGYAAVRHEGALYVGTSFGLYRLRPGTRGHPDGAGARYSAFEKVAGFSEQVWSLLSVQGDLLVGTNDGVLRLAGGQLIPVQRSSESAFQLQAASWDPSTVLIGMKAGVGAIQRRSSGWADLGAVEGVASEVRSLASVNGWETWAGLMSGGVARLYLTPEGTIGADLETEGMDSGTVVSEANDEILVAESGDVRILRLEAGGLQFYEIEDLDELPASFSLLQRGDGGVWIASEGDMLGGHIRDEAFVVEDRLTFGWAQVVGAYPEPSGVIWVLTVDGLIRYDPGVDRAPLPFPAYVRRVSVASGERDDLYGGALSGAQLSTAPVFAIPYATNDLRFEYAAATFQHPERTEYQIFLEGQHEDWTPWRPEAHADFTNLAEGNYTFRVRARDAQGRTSQEAVFVFRVLPPWYRTVWAYIGYALALGLFVWAVLAWQMRKQRRKLAAQRVRTERATRLNARLQEINARLRRADKLKDDLLANTSHELRTPLTAVLGYTELLLDETEGETRTLAEGVWRGGNRLLSTVNSLLDMYKLQSGSMELHPSVVDVGAQVRETVRLLAPLAEERGIALAVLPEGLEVQAEVDRAALDRIVMNLVGNAIKFTTEGAVTVLLDADAQWVHLTVRDTGCGIEPEFLPRVFEPFEQASTGHARSHEGSGLGLAIVQRLVDLSGGEVEAESVPGEGTAFRVRLPRSQAAVVLTAPASGTAEAVAPASMGGAEVLVIANDGTVATALRGVVEPHGRVRVASSPTRAAREARRTSFDLIVVEAGDAREEMRSIEAVRRVPGYALSAVIRAGGEPLSAEALAARGFTHQVSEITDEALVFSLLEGLLMKVEAPVPFDA